jgi:hypothetical protein
MLQIGAINNSRVPIIFHSRVWYANQKASHMQYIISFSCRRIIISDQIHTKIENAPLNDFLVRACVRL